MISQEDIAKSLNLSVATVSRSLRQHESICPQTRARVLEKAAQLGYRLRKDKRTEQRKALTQIGVLIRGYRDMLTHEVAGRMLHGMTEAAREHDLLLTVDYISPEDSKRLHYAEFQPPGLRAGAFNGVILIGDYPLETIEWLSSQLPVIRMANYHTQLSVDCVDHNDVRGSADGIAYMRKLGHKDFGFIGSVERAPYSRMRYLGYVNALAEFNEAQDSANVINQFGPSLAPEIMAKLVAARLAAGVTGWLAANDRTAYDILAALRDLGIEAAEDISMVGFDHFSPKYNLPQLTSLEPPFEDMGATAVNCIIQRLQQPLMESRHVLLNCKLIPGLTTGAYPSCQ